MNVLPDGAMAANDHQADRVCSQTGKRSRWTSFVRSRDGSAAIEFALLAIPYFMVVFAILETFVAFAAEQLVSNAVDTMSRRMRTGQITNAAGQPSYLDQTAFRRAFCGEVSILIQCSEAEITTPDKLWIDVRTFSKFSDIPAAIPMNATGLDTTAMQYSPGGSGSINMVRAYYHWQIITDLVRPYITPYKTATGARLNDYLIVATAAFQNEKY